MVIPANYLLEENGPSYAQICIPITQECMVLLLITIDIVVLEKKDSAKILIKHFHCTTLLQPLRKGAWFSFEQTYIIITPDCFVINFREIGPVLKVVSIF